MDKNKTIGVVLAGIASAGVVAVAYLSSKAGVKADKCETKKEKIKAYIPTAAACTITVAAIVTGTIFSSKATATAAAATAACAAAVKKYKPDVEKIIDEYESRQEHEPEPMDIPDPDETVTFFDYRNLRYFDAKFRDVVEKVTMDDGMEVYIVNTPEDERCF